jgi:hypothetical protein
MKNPVPVSQLAQQDYMKCQLPDSGKEICNGLENMTISSGVVQSSLLNTCSFTTSNFGTCFNCPSTAPTVDNPTPDAASSDRHLVPDNCDGVWWDPIAGQCLCQNTTCAFNETYTPLTTQ